VTVAETTGATPTAGQRDPGEQRTPDEKLPDRKLWPSLLLAVGSGLLMLLAFPPYGLWWTAPLAVAAFTLACRDRRFWPGFGLGALAGVTFFAPLLEWTNLHTGATPWILLSGLQAVYFALLGGAYAWARPVTARWPWAAPLLVGGLWTVQEALRDRTPFGGFPWGRLAFSQGDAPLLRLAALGGAPLVTFAVAVCGGLLAAAVLALTGRTAVRAAGFAGAALVLAVAPLAVPTVQPAGRGVVVAIVQGNVPRLGLDFNEQRRAVLDNHVEATIRLAADVAAGRAARPDLVIWPENSSDIDPLRNGDAAARIDEAAAAIDAPILVGAVLLADGNGVYNAGLVWQAGQGPTQRYVKQHPVPFAEYIPLRRIARMVSDQVDRVTRDFIPGTESGVLTMGPATVGDVICFEVAYDDLVRDTVTGGAQLLAVQTNNATFDAAEAGQQLAMVRLRAVEHGRAALMASTVGISGFVDADGTVHDATEFNTQRVVLRELRLGSGRTLATTVGPLPEYLIVAATLLILPLAAWSRRRRRAETQEGS
jgi:apolipoprotein N-acyltransferase